MIKNIFIIILSATLLVSALFNFIAFKRISSYEWEEEVERFYQENKDTLNKFVDICFKNEIKGIVEFEYKYISGNIHEKIGDYFVYSNLELNKNVIIELTEIFLLFKKYKIYDITVSENYCAGILFGIGDISKISLAYTIDKPSIEQIKKDSFYNKVRYIDENWYIGTGD